MFDPYEILGVGINDDEKVIKKAYRKLANKFHPDKELGDTKKFQEIKEAYELLKLKKEKTNANNSFKSSNFTGPQSHTHDNFSRVFTRAHRTPNRFINVNADISIINAVNGGKRDLTIHYDGAPAPVTFTIDIPKGIVEGEVLRYPGILGNGTIDLIVTFRIRKDSTWQLDGLNIIKNEYFTFWELITGTVRDVPTIYGGKVRLKIPPRSKPGTKLKVKSYGSISRQNYMMKGDMYVVLQATMPVDIPDEILNSINDLTE